MTHLILNAEFPSYAESEWLLSQLDRRGLLFNARFAAGAADLSASMPGSEAWILSEGVSETREQLATVLRD